eukprot:13697428-Alexandrium_andersonii.AAC.1
MARKTRQGLLQIPQEPFSEAWTERPRARAARRGGQELQPRSSAVGFKPGRKEAVRLAAPSVDKPACACAVS